VRRFIAFGDRNENRTSHTTIRAYNGVPAPDALLHVQHAPCWQVVYIS
jgi:hypothetical protein